jgi:aminomethyltransferase
MLAVQGPQARPKVAHLLSPSAADAALALEPFCASHIDRGAQPPWFIARTGYTGEDGFEVMLPCGEAQDLWRNLNRLGVASCGLGARDTLRLEAGMNLYGNDMDETTHPFESGLTWTVAMQPAERDFIGRQALERIRAAGVGARQIGLVLEDRGILRSHQRVLVADSGEGQITSGSYSPTLERSIALASIPVANPTRVQVDVRGKLLDARVVKLPFVRFGKSLLN